MTGFRAAALAVALLAALVIVAAGCASAGATAVAPTPGVPTATIPSESAPASDAGSPPVVVPDSPLAGIVVAIDSAGLDQVRGFTLRTNSGTTVEFAIGTLESGDEFPPGHLKEHQATAAPVLVFFRPDGANLVVYRIEDAG
jgi:hypothetical protein